MLDELVALVVPPRCAACARAGPARGGVALRRLPPRAAVAARAAAARAARSRCRTRRALPGAGAAFDAAWAAVAYEGVAREALLALKFSAARPLAGVMAAQIAAAPPALLARAHARRRSRPSAPAPRPRLRSGRADRAALARRSGLPLRARAAPRRRRSRQLGASRALRRDAAGSDFRACGPAPARVVLVDDVHTTGATLHACAAALQRAGCRQIAAITWARTLDDSPR